MDTGFPTVVWRLCLGLGCAWVQVSAAPSRSWLACWGSVCVYVRTLLVLRHSWLGCAVWMCVLGFGFRLCPATLGWGVAVCVFVCALRLYPATPGWAVRCGCVCLGSGFGCAPPLLVGLCSVGVCTWARVSAALRHSGLGCWGVCVLVCALRLYPATPGWGVRLCVCLGSSCGYAPQLLAGVLGCACLCACSACTMPLRAGACGVGVCAWAWVSAAPRHSWLGSVVWVCVLALRFVLGPATPGSGVGLCMCLCVRSACTPPLRAGVFGVGVCAWAWVSAVPRHSWLGCWVMCVLCALRLYPATPGWGVRCGRVCLSSGFGCAPPLLAGVVGCVCVCARSACTPPFLAGACGVGVCAWGRVLAAPRHLWVGGGVWVCVLGLGFRLRPATPG